MEPDPTSPVTPSAHDKVILAKLRHICDEFRNNHDDDLTDAWQSIDSLKLDIGPKNRVTSALRAGITDMIRKGHANDGIAMAIIDKVYIKRKEYGEVYEICNDLLSIAQDGKRATREGILIEYMVNRAVNRIVTNPNPKAHSSLAPKLIGLLERRAGMLGMDMDMRHDEANEFQRALEISRDIYARQRLEPAATLDPWLKAHYRRTYAFLGLSPEKIAGMVKKRVDLAYYASMARESPQLEDSAPNTLDCLESMIGLMESRGMPVHNRGQYAPWRGGLCHRKFLQYAFEMRLYVHFSTVTKEIGLEPAIEDGKFADLRVCDCYIEAYAPRDVAAIGLEHMFHTNSRSGLLRKLFTKDQIGHFGARESLLIVEDPRNYVADMGFLAELAERIKRSKRVGGVLIAKDMGRHYKCALVKSPVATPPILPATEEMVIGALETAYG